MSRSTPISPAPAVVAIEVRSLLRQLFVVLLLAELLLVYLDVVVTYFEAVEHEAIQDLCNLVIEGSMGGWFSSVQTLVVGLVLLLVRLRVRSEGTSRRRAVGWGVAAFFFLYMAFDDGSAFHEALGTAFEDSQTGAAGEGAALVRAFPSYPWQLLFLPFLGTLGAFVAVWSWRELPRRSSRMLVLIGLACFAAAVGLDFVEGMETPYERLTATLLLHEDTIPHFSGVIEEFVEMFGTTLLLYAYLDHLLWLCRDLHLRLRGWMLDE